MKLHWNNLTPNVCNTEYICFLELVLIYLLQSSLYTLREVYTFFEDKGFLQQFEGGQFSKVKKLIFFNFLLLNLPGKETMAHTV